MLSSPPPPPPSLKQTQERIPYISKDKRAHTKSWPLGLLPETPRVWGLEFEAGFLPPRGFLKDSKAPQTKTAAWLMAHIETTNYKMINRFSKLFQERLCCQD
ncbi:unnamed protein product [Rangifer tarandus platyrhynchus]|uniref:Uncharacterized protein n=1 Tax=Rangifer tarandus platyrhynchus TaxID=3082113 RepID=A0AC59ZVW4_RANTA